MHFDIIVLCGRANSIKLEQYDSAEYQMSIAYLTLSGIYKQMSLSIGLFKLKLIVYPT